MKIQRSITWEGGSPYHVIEMGNSFDRDIYISLAQADGGITGRVTGWSRLGKSYIYVGYRVTPEEDAEEEDPEERGGYHVGSILLPKYDEIDEEEVLSCHTIPLYEGYNKPPRPATNLVLCITPGDFVYVHADQHDVYKLVDDDGNEIPLESLLSIKS